MTRTAYLATAAGLAIVGIFLPALASAQTPDPCVTPTPTWELTSTAPTSCDPCAPPPIILGTSAFVQGDCTPPCDKQDGQLQTLRTADDCNPGCERDCSPPPCREDCQPTPEPTPTPTTQVPFFPTGPSLALGLAGAAGIVGLVVARRKG